MTPNRPLTHDLFKNTLGTFDIELKEVIINNLLDGIFYARLICLKDGEEIEIDSRTSDALAMAVRFNCPIYTYEFILDAAGVILEDPEEEKNESSASGSSASSSTASSSRKRQKKSKSTALSSYSEEDLTKMLEEVLGDEDYERAAEIRDELKRREKSKSSK